MSELLYSEIWFDTFPNFRFRGFVSILNFLQMIYGLAELSIQDIDNDDSVQFTYNSRGNAIISKDSSIQLLNCNLIFHKTWRFPSWLRNI